MEEMTSDSVYDFGDFLSEKGIPSNYISILSGEWFFGALYWSSIAVVGFEDNHVDAETFLELSEVEIKELNKPLGIVKKLVIL